MHRRPWQTPGTLLILMSVAMPVAFSTWNALLNNFVIERAAFTGVEIGIITARTSELVRHRMESLNIKHIYQGKLEKLPALEEMVAKVGVSFEETAYVGDDVIDLPAMRNIGFAISVQDAHPLVKQHSHWQTHHVGGRGAARDVCELIMEAQNTLQAQFDKYLHD